MTDENPLVRDEAAVLGLYRGIVESSTYAFVVADEVGAITFASKGLELVSGYLPADIVGNSIADYVHPDDLEISLRAFTEVGPEWGMREGEGVPLVLRTATVEGGWKEVEIGAQNRLDDPQVQGIVLRVRPAGGEQGLARILALLTQERPMGEVFEALAVSLLDGLPGTVAAAVAFDWDGERFASVAASGRSAALLERLGTSTDGPAHGVPEGSSWVDTAVLAPPLDAEADDEGVLGIWLHPVTELGQHGCLLAAREFRGPPWTTHEMVLARASSLVALALERRQQTAELRHAARHDSLTGLGNRVTFFEAFELALAAPDVPSAVIYVDLDHFKPVNDTHGHAAGDEVLRAAAMRLRTACRPGDTISRLGGDEFAVLCPGVSSAEVATDVGERFLASMAEGFDALPDVATVGASVGIVFVPASATPDDRAQVLETVDHQLYEAKRSGGSTLRATTFATPAA